HTDQHDIVWYGTVDRREFETMADRIIDKYLCHPNYYLIDGNPVFCIYDMCNLIGGLGGVHEAAEALDWMRSRAVSKGLPGIHFQAIRMKDMPAEIYRNVADFDSLRIEEMIRRLGFSSVTHYQYVHEAGEAGEYIMWAEKATSGWLEYADEYPLYFPHVSIGWDNTQRNPDNKEIVSGSSPENFKVYLRKAKAYLDERPEQPQLVTVNSWNEWTEGSYLLPDRTWNYGYLEAVQEVFNV
ncbi:MAG: hypothetical protein HN368_08245, partial [Spirochaetales bacterium]|nr:hypothetical protein [Spirochaetales bacterium]